MVTEVYKLVGLFLTKMEKKAAIGLSMNVLVIIIISLVILAGGITLLYKFIGGAEEIKGQLDSRTDMELERLLVDQGKKVALPLQVADVERGSTHVFGIGILNIDPELAEFWVVVELSKYVDETQVDLTDTLETTSEEYPENWPLFFDQIMTIAEGEHRKESILITVPDTAPPGQYIFSVVVNANYLERPAQYGNTQRFIVNVG
jgi:hypothetical protein